MLDQWDARYPNCPPMGHLLRTAFPARWVRFHSLPESKRYPESEAEYTEVLRRHNQILAELARPDDRVFVLQGRYFTPASADETGDVEAGAVLWRTIASHEIDGDPGDPLDLRVFAREQEWQPGSFDPLVRRVADWETGNVLIVAEDCRWVLHPYDGGMDVILQSPRQRDDLKMRYSEWLSVHAHGL